AFAPLFEDMGLVTKAMAPPTLDPSPKQNWWDRMRRRMHGTYTLEIYNARCRLLVGVNIYDPTDNLEFSLGYIRGIASTGRYQMHAEDVRAKKNPCFPYFKNLVEFPEMNVELKFRWDCEMDPFDHYFPIILPPEFRTEEGLLKYKDSIEFDAYKKWRAKNCHCEFFGEVRSAKSDDCITSYPSIMFDPLTNTWFIHFVTFMSQDPLQIHLGRVYKFGKKLDQFDVFDFLKSFQITIKFNNTNMVWSNGMED